LSWASQLLNWLLGFSQFVAGIVVGTFITGVFTWKVVLPKALQNERIVRLMELLEAVVERADKIVEALDEVLESQRINKSKGEGKMTDPTLPPCLGYFGDKTIPPNKCNNCPFRDACSRVIARRRLQPIIARILKMEKALRGAKI